MPPRCQTELEAALKKTRNNSGLTFSIALNYGARHEILTAVRKAAAAVASGKMTADTIDEAFFLTAVHRRIARSRPVDSYRRRDAHQQFPALADRLYRDLVTKRLWPDFTKEIYWKP